MAYLRSKLSKVNESADDLDGYASDDAPMSQKIPDSQVKMNTELFGANHPNGLAPSAEQGQGISVSTNINFFKVVNSLHSLIDLEVSRKNLAVSLTQTMIMV
jgi:hypothetical protein